jgi:DNA-binding FrmR family transcriptional regulator
MSAVYPLSVHRRVERQWAERINSLRQIHGQIVGIERTLQRVFNNHGSLILVSIRAVADRRQLDQSRPHD